MSDNFKTGYDSIEIVKGDIVIDENGLPLMLNWKVSKHINNMASQAIMLNEILTFERWHDDELDEQGFLVTPKGYEVIVDKMPVNITPYAGRPDYIVSQNTPGIVADSLYTAQIQLNPTTVKLRINDEFDYGNERYRIINIDWSESNITQDRGILNLNMKRVGGGTYYDE